MKRFLISIIGISAMMAIIIVIMHMICILKLKTEVNAAYTIMPGQKYLFLGSSQFGCGIEESPKWENKVLWVSDTTVKHSLIRLRELDKRGQLECLIAVLIPWNFIIPLQYTDRVLKWGWYQELPVSIFHMEDYPFCRIGFPCYIASNLRYPFCMFASCEYPKGRPSISQRPALWQKKFHDSIVSEASRLSTKNNCKCWKEMLESDIREFKRICDKNSIRLYVVKMPVLSEYRNSAPKEILLDEEVWLKKLQDFGVDVLTPEQPQNEEDLFFDAVHFMEPGTKLFTEAVFKCIREAEVKTCTSNVEL